MLFIFLFIDWWKYPFRESGESVGLLAMLDKEKNSSELKRSKTSSMLRALFILAKNGLSPQGNQKSCINRT